MSSLLYNKLDKSGSKTQPNLEVCMKPLEKFMQTQFPMEPSPALTMYTIFLICPYSYQPIPPSTQNFLLAPILIVSMGGEPTPH